MRQGRSGLRYMAVGLGSMAAGALLIVGGLPGTAGATHVDPTEEPGNAKCPAGTTELKVEPVESGTFSDGTLTVTLVVTGDTFSWTSNIGVDVVIVKGGNVSNVYTYDPESTGDTGLHAPINPNTGEPFGLSHVSFCYDVEQPTTSTTSTSTTSTSTTSTSTTSTSTTSTTVPDTTSTTMGATTSSAGVSPTTVPPPGELPRTGSTTGPMLGLGAALLAGGAGLVGFARRFRHS
jgi:LPXTG-motif cell wall-anchored protein